MPGQYFISYSDADGRNFARKLHDALEPAFSAWLDKNDLKPGRDWDMQFREAISGCDAFLFVMTPDSVEDTCTCKQEYTDALKFKKAIIPLKAHHDVQLPFRLNTRQYIDFSSNFDAALSKLREHLEWLPSPEGILQSMQDRLADANRDLRRADDTNRARIEVDITQLKQDIDKQKKIVENPQAAAQRTQSSIDAAIKREQQPAKPISGIARTKFINQPPGVAPSYFQDRYEENKIIGKFLRDESCRMITVVGRAGIGKTAMVCRLLKSLESGRLPDDLGELLVDGIVYLSAVGTRVVNVPNLFADLCQLLPDEKSRELDALYKNPQVATEAKINALLAAFPSGRFIVLLDNFENVLDAETMNIRDAELDEALHALLNAPHHAVKVILTTRIAPHDLGFVQPGRQARLNLDNGLEPKYAKNVLTENDADGTLGLKNAPDDLLTRACEFTRGFPRALEALIAILRADRYTSLAEILANAIPPDKVVEALVGEAFNRLDPNAQRVMQALAVYNRPVTPAALDYLLQPFAASIDSAPVLNRLVTMQFVRRETGRYYLHPVDRAYAFGRLPRTPAPLLPLRAEEQRSGGAEANSFNQHDLTTRAADYFAQTRKPRETWKKLADIEPQLNEFDLRCAAEDYDTAASVLLDIEFDYLLLWGHYRLMSKMNESLYGKVQNADLQAGLLNYLGISAYSTSQIQKAILYFEQSLSLTKDLKDKQGEGAALNNLGNCYLHLGNIHRAIQYYEQALAIAREIGNKVDEGNSLGNLGNSYNDLGDTRRAIKFYNQVIAISRETKNRLTEAIALEANGKALVAQNQLDNAIQYFSQAIRIADNIGYIYTQNLARYGLGIASLYSGNLPIAHTAAAQAGQKYDEPENNHNVAALLGIITLRQNDVSAAQEAFTAAIQHADKILALTPEYYDALDAKGVALCGLALVEDNGQERINRTNQAIEVFHAARKINKDAGIVARVVRLLDALALAHPNGAEILAEARKAAEGKG